MDIKYKKIFENNKKILLDKISEKLETTATHEMITGWESWGDTKLKVIAKANGKKCKIELNFNDIIERAQIEFCFLATDPKGRIGFTLEEIAKEFEEYVA